MEKSNANKINDYSDTISTKLGQAKGVVYFLQQANEQDKELHDSLWLVFGLLKEAIQAEEEMYELVKASLGMPVRKQTLEATAL